MAGLVVALMIIPIVAAVTREVFAATPRLQREAVLALGGTRWDVIRRVVLPIGRTGVLAAVLLGLGRAVGETIAVTMVIGNCPAGRRLRLLAGLHAWPASSPTSSTRPPSRSTPSP